MAALINKQESVYDCEREREREIATTTTEKLTAIKNRGKLLMAFFHADAGTLQEILFSINKNN